MSKKPKSQTLTKSQALKTIKSLVLEIEKYEEDYKKKLKGAKKSVSFLIKMNALKSIRDRLAKIQRLLEVEKYKLAFIGKIGVGKTTAICHLLNLLVSEEKMIDGEKEEVITPLLSTGSGRTTICEVLIQGDSDKTYIQLDPYSDEEMREQIEIFCMLTWKKLNPNSKGWMENLHYQDEQIDILSSELKRAIKNIAKLKSKEEEDIAKTHKSYESFRDEIITRCELGKRTKTTILTSHTDRIKKKKWIQKNFQDLNLGKINSCAIPKKITIYIDSTVLDLSQYRFHSVIDTRGMDSDADREDLSYHIRYANDTICIFSEKFSDIPSNVMALIKKYLTSDSKDVATKLFLLGLPQRDEPKELMDQDGKVSSYDQGIKVRLEQILDQFQSNNIQFIEENIRFYNSLRHYDSDGCQLKLPRIEKERNDILDVLSRVIDFREQCLIDEVINLVILSQKIRAGEIDENDKDLIEKLKKTVEKINDNVTSYGISFKNSFLKALQNYHVMVFRAINNRYGNYDHRNINIYFNARSITEELARNCLEKTKSEIMGAIERTDEQAAKNSNLKYCLPVLKDKVSSDYEELIIQLGNIGYELVSDYFSPKDYNNEFWESIICRWGQGPGYRNDVLGYYNSKLGSIDKDLEKNLEKGWQSDFLVELLEFLSI